MSNVQGIRSKEKITWSKDQAARSKDKKINKIKEQRLGSRE